MAKYLKKQSVLDYLNEYLNALKRDNYDTTFHKAQRKALRSIIQDIQAMDSTEIVIRYGRWIDLDGRILCSCCGTGYDDKDEVKINTYLFCPNCGARMIKDGEQNDD